MISLFKGVVTSSALQEIRLDFAYYSPPSLVLKKFGWLEEEFKADSIPVKRVHSAASNRSLEYLNRGSVDFGSTAGLAGVLSRANGNPIKGVYIYSRPVDRAAGAQGFAERSLRFPESRSRRRWSGSVSTRKSLPGRPGTTRRAR